MKPTLSHLPLLALLLASQDLGAQLKPQLAPQAASPVMLEPAISVPVDLLPAGKTQGTFLLNGLVRPDQSVLLRWANDQGEMPTEGVSVFRQRVGDTTWKDLTGSRRITFMTGKAAQKRLDKMQADTREDLLGFAFGDVQHDPATRLRSTLVPAKGPKRAKDLTPEDSARQFRDLRLAGRLSRGDLQLLSARADLESDVAEVLGLTYVDEPGRGQWRYKIVVTLPEGGTVEAICPKVFDRSVPTEVPQPLNLSASSGNGEVLLNWDEAPSDVVAGYNIYRKGAQREAWTRINVDPVKKVTLDLEDPATSLKRAVALQASMSRSLRPLPAGARTPQKVQEAYAQAVKETTDPKALKALPPSVEQAIQSAVAAGKLRPAGPQAPVSAYTDSRRSLGSRIRQEALQDEHTYQYKVTAVDIGGLEQPLATAPVVEGTPRDLEPPRTPGKPILKAEAEALTQLQERQQTRLKDPRLLQADTHARSLATVPLTPFQLAPPPVEASVLHAPAPPALQRDAQRLQLSRVASTMPVAALRKVTEAAVLHSQPDGSAPPAPLTWASSPDGDLKQYEVYRATGQGPFSKVAEVVDPAWTDTTLEVGQAYRYTVAAVDRLGNVSTRSPEGRVEVSDSGLPARLAVLPPASKVSEELPTATAHRRLARPLGRVQAAGSLWPQGTGRFQVQVQKAGSEPMVLAYHAPKLQAAPRTHGFRPVAKVAAVSQLKALAPTPKALDSLQPSHLMKPTVRPIARSLNPMLALPPTPKELFVLLEWARPVQGFPMEYDIQQAPRLMDVVSVPRPPVQHLNVLRGWASMRAPMTARGGVAEVAPKATPQLATAPAPHADPLALTSRLATTPQLHASVAKGLVAAQGGGLRLSDVRLNQQASLQVKLGPGPFARINETPVTAERFVTSFPAEVAQYGGATFYFRIKASTREFGRRVEGPMGEPIEVRLPDIVPPPSPMVGSIDLREGQGSRLDVALSWTQISVPDLAGFLVDRQAMAFTLVEGEAHPGAALGTAARLTSAPVSALTYLDARPPAGYQRYTLRSVDKTGNISEPLGSLDVVVPGEPMPGAPTQVALAGDQLSWHAAEDAAGYTIWRSFTGQDADYVCISGLLGPTVTHFGLPAEGRLHLKVVARSPSGMNQTASVPVIRTP